MYQNGILILPDADRITQELPLSWEPLVVPLPRKLTLPVGLTYDPEGKRLLVANYDMNGKQIYSISLGSDYQVEAMKPVVTSKYVSRVFENSIICFHY